MVAPVSPLPPGAQGEPHGELARLVCDLKKTDDLCRAKEYPGVTLDELNAYVAKHGPLVNPAFGKIVSFSLDQGRYFPHKMASYAAEAAVAEIAKLLGIWAAGRGDEGRVTTSQGAFVLEEGMVRIPDTAYTAPEVARTLSYASRWTYSGRPFAPAFVVEVDKLSGEHSSFAALDRKMRRDYLAHGVRLGWLIDPRPHCRRMVEYRRDPDGQIVCVDEPAWRDLDGGEVLPGFKLRKEMLEVACDARPCSPENASNSTSDENSADRGDGEGQEDGQEKGQEEEEEEGEEEEDHEVVCPSRRCGLRFGSANEFAAHYEEHRQDQVFARYKRARRNQPTTQRARRMQRTR